MTKYYVNKNPQTNGDHEVHKEGCDWMVPELVEFECRITHPKMINPITNDEFTEIVEAKDEWTDELGFDFYTLEFDWEIQFGEWLFEIIHDGKVLASQSFYLKEFAESYSLN